LLLGSFFILIFFVLTQLEHMICNKNSYCTNLRQHDINSQHNETHVDKKANSKIKVRVLNKVRRVLVRHDASPWVKGVGN